ncbi:trypsin-like serine protease [Streptomyces sp. NPDC020965]|uniref:trypsin-like serine protease n=1 Tax=Streptomyces sp. NPDC020965 TaxID=3365105 RepID=UPI0037A39BF9
MFGASPALADEQPRPNLPQRAAQSQAELDRVVREVTRAKPAKTGRLISEANSPALADGKPSARIIGGKPTTISAAPWMAQLNFEIDNDWYSCGGVVIAPTKIATAAHCVQGVKWRDAGFVVVGTAKVPDYSVKPPNYYGGQQHRVVRQWHHPLYKADTLDNDVAVLTLDTPTSVKPLPLAQPTDGALYKAGNAGKVYGWGRVGTGPNDGGSDILKVADADVVSDAKCKAAYPTGVTKFVAGHMLCAGAAPTGSDETSETTCHGDSGGPLVVGGRLAGIVSWGDEDCVAKGKYGVYAKFSTYSAPIQGRVDDTNWHVKETGRSDHTADLLARRTSDKSLFAWHSNVKSLSRQANLGNYGAATLLLQTDFDRNGAQDTLIRVANGDVYRDYYDYAKDKWQTKLIAKAWKKHKQIVTPGDVTGDELPDMIAVDSSGTQFIYPGKGNGSFAAPVRVGTGWGAFTMVRGHGDFTLDGKADIFATKTDGKTYLYKGTGVATKPWAAPVLVGAFSAMNAIITTGDVNSDGVADVLTRDKTGKLWLYPGKGNGGFNARVAFGSGWQAYNLFG